MGITTATDDEDDHYDHDDDGVASGSAFCSGSALVVLFWEKLGTPKGHPKHL